MNFLSPWFLAAGVLIAGPIVAHLIRRATRDRVVFSNLRLLDPSRPRLQRRSRIQNPWLLALRCLVVALLAAAFARPFFPPEPQRPVAAERRQDLVIVLDQSASMRRSGLWQEATDRILRRAEGLGANDRLALYFAAERATAAITFEQWLQTPASDRLQRLRALLAAQQPGWGPFYLDSAVDTALEPFSETSVGAARQQLVIVSDFTGGSRIAGLAGRDWPRGCSVVLENTSRSVGNNAGLQFLGFTDPSAGPVQARVRISRDKGAPALPLKLQLRDAQTQKELGSVQTFDIPSGENRLALVSIPPESEGPLEVDLAGDSEAFDNRVWFVREAPRADSIAYYGPSDLGDPQSSAFYLSRALASPRTPAAALTVVDPQAVTAPPAPLHVVAAPLSAPLRDALRARLQGGEFALVLVSSSELVSTAANLAGENDWKQAPVRESDALLGKIDFAHPLFSVFSDPRYSDFTRLRFWHPLSIAFPSGSAATIVARFDDNAPAIAEVPVGRGRLILWPGDWVPASSQWVLSTKFVPWLQNLLERASGGPPLPAYSEIHDAGKLARSPGARWTGLTGAPSPQTPTQPGVYRLEENGTSRWVALEVPAEESRTDPLPLDAFEQMGVPLKPVFSPARASSTSRSADAVEAEAEQKLWRWLLLATAFLLAVESIAASTVTRREAAAAKP